jgi:1-aminocyclopropane-1-carboxylate deaminase
LFSQLIHTFEQSLHQIPAVAASGLLREVDIQPLRHPLFASRDIQVNVLRSDLLHPVISGNKWFKLKYNLLQALRQRDHTLESYGGAWSNHLHALAYTAQLAGLRSRGLVRGDELDGDANPMLQEAQRWGMELAFLSRQDYRLRCNAWLQPQGSGTSVIPAGGDNWLGTLGCISMLPAAAGHHDLVLLPVGTGCTFAGVRLALPARVAVWGVAVLKGAWQQRQMQQRLYGWPGGVTCNWQLLTGYHGGGYGRADKALLSFIAEFGHNTQLPLEPVYSGKALYALCDLVQHNRIPAGSRVLFIHTGGLQGARGYQSLTG